MKYFFCLFAILSLVYCKNPKEETVLVDTNCDNTKLVDYVYPVNNFLEGKTFVYSLKSNQEATIDTIRKEFKVYKDSLLVKISKDTLGVITDSTVFKVTNGIPETLDSYTKAPSLNPDLLPTKTVITGNRYCEFSTYKSTYSYTIPTINGDMSREFKGHTTHKGYVKKQFNNVEYECALFESEKTVTVSIKGMSEKLKGTWKGCGCKGLGELYSTTTLENGLVLEQQLEEIIE